MTPVQIIRDAQTRQLVSEDNEPLALRLSPPLSDAEIDAFAETLPCPLPDDVRELLSYCRGFDGLTFEPVDFTGRDMAYGDESVFPFPLPIATDGFGNHWVVDLTPESTAFGPLYFSCHDAPVVLLQCQTLSEFLVELFKMYSPPHQSLVDDVHDDRIRDIWGTNPDVLDHETCLKSPDPILSGFAATLDSTWQIIDLRNAKSGDGFSWGRYGSQTMVQRFGYYPVFAYQIRKGFFRRLFGG